jgi:hypothetical protein
MTYDPLTPNSVQSPKDQVTAVQGNFDSFASVFSSTAAGVIYNHTPFNVAKQGNHEAILMETQGDDPDVDEDLVAVYSKDSASQVSTEPQLFFRLPVFLPTKQDTNTPGNPPTQITYSTVNTAGPQYQSFLPGGYVTYFGSVTATGNVTLVPAPTAIVLAIAVPTSGIAVVNDVSTEIVSNDTFSINSDSASGVFSFSYFVIAQA